MEKKHKDILTKYLPRFVEEVDPQQLLAYLPCLSKYSKETVDTAQSSKSRSYAAQVLHNHLERRPKGFRQLVEALRHENVGLTELADLLDPNHCFDPSRREQSQEQCNSAANPSCNRGNHLQCNDAPVGATGRTPIPQRTLTVSNVRLSPNHWQIKSPPIYELTTPWQKLPASVLSILKKFDVQNSLCTIEDLGDLLGFNIEQIQMIESKVIAGQSKTLTFLENYRGIQEKPITLGDIMFIFNRLDRKDIVHDLEEKTGVKFTQEETGESTQACTRQEETMQDQIQSRTGPTGNNQNMNLTLEKACGNAKKVLDFNTTMKYHNNIEQDNKEREKAAETYRQRMDNSELQSIVDDCIDEYKKNEMITPYKREEIICNRNPDSHEWQRDSSSSKKDDTVFSRNLSREISEPRNSEGFLCPNTFQNENGPIQNEENNLNRSVSTCSSNTENNSYDSMPATIYDNKLKSDDEHRPVSPKVCNINDGKDELCNGDSSLAKPDGTVNLEETDMIIDNRSADKLQMVKEVTVNENHRNLTERRNVCQKNELRLNNDVALEKVVAELNEDQFQQKILKDWKTYSDVISQSDPSESRDASKVISCSASPSRRLDEEVKIIPSNVESSYLTTDDVDHSLLDEEANRPKLASLTGEMNSLQRKANKQFPGQYQCFTSSNDVETDNYFDENPTGSFQIDWQMSLPENEDCTEVSIDGKTEEIHLEQATLKNHPSDGLLHQTSDKSVEDGEFVRRGPSNLLLTENKDIQLEKEKINENVLTPETVGDHSRTSMASENGPFETACTDINSSDTNFRQVDINEVRDEEPMVVEGSQEIENTGINTHENLSPSRLINDLENITLKDSLISICNFVRLVYENSL